MSRNAAKNSRSRNAEPAPSIDFSMEELEGEPSKPSDSIIQAIDRAIELVRAGAATVHVKGETEHQCQVLLVPLFIDLVRPERK